VTIINLGNQTIIVPLELEQCHTLQTYDAKNDVKDGLYRK